MNTKRSLRTIARSKPPAERTEAEFIEMCKLVAGRFGGSK